MFPFPRILHNFPFLACTRHRTIFSAFGIPPPLANKQEQYNDRKILPYPQHQLYDLVADVDSYHRFVPYCTASRVLKKTPRSGRADKNVVNLQAELSVGFLGFEEKYISEVECRPCEMVQAVASAEIPLFKRLVTTWRFQPSSSASLHSGADLASALHTPAVENGPTLLTFELEYAFANPLHAHLSAAFFGQVSKMMIAAFEERCLQVYGPGMK